MNFSNQTIRPVWESCRKIRVFFCILAGDGALIENSPTYPLGFLLLCGVCTPNHLFFGLII